MIKNYFLLFTMILLSLSCTKQPSKIEYEINRDWKFKQVNKTEWLRATVPGTVHTDLIDNKKIEDPFFRINEHSLQWIDKVDWEYKTTLQISKEDLQNENIQLQFYGLDTFTKIYLNNQLISQTDNMFRRYTFEVKKYLKLNDNELRIVFESPIKKGIEKYDSLGYKLPVSDNDMAEIGKVKDNKKVSPFIRKAGYHFGWDWGPRLVTSGIWRPVKLKMWNKFNIKDLYVKQNKLVNIAELTANVEVEATGSLDVDISILVNDESVKEVQYKLEKGLNKITVPFQINNAELWWPNGMGAQTLYNIRAEVVSSSYKDSTSRRIGLRNIELVTEPDSIGESFYFKVNGKPIFAKGANYIPQDIFLPRVDEKKYNEIIQAAKNTNMNMLRVWSGGIYENNIFYDKCDEAGIMVWQDFMFPISMFPYDSTLFKSIKLEAIDNVKRLRNHSSIALWCGNNEILEAWNKWGWKKQVVEEQSQSIADTLWKSYKKIFHEVLPQVISQYDSGRTYWSSSPSSSMGLVSSLDSGDAHYWDVWWGQEPFEKYSENIPRFMSEFGFQSFPDFSSVRKYTFPKDWNIYSDVMKSHQRSNIGNETIEKYLHLYYKTPSDFESLLYVSQLLQAYGVTYAIETHRRNKPKCMGSIYWQIDDCWPVASWSSIDYYGKWKALHYEVKNVFKNFILSLEHKSDSINVFVVSDSLKNINAKLVVDEMGFDGKKINHWEKEINVIPNSSKNYLVLNSKELYDKDNKGKRLLYCKLIYNNKIIVDKIFYFVPPKQLDLPKVNLELFVKKNDEEILITVTTDNLAKNVFISAATEYNFSDNYFDMLPNSRKVITIPKSKIDNIDNIKNSIKAISLIDTY